RVCVRLTYTKRGRARFIGSLELTTLFYRAARRARLPLAFTQGHHPMPRFAFGPALPMGMESDCEFLDIDLVEPLDAGAVHVALQGQLPEGMTIIAAETVPLRGSSISASISAFRYRIELGAVIRQSDAAHIRSRLDAFIDAADFPLRKHSKG